MTALDTLLDGLIDYAGLYPPASLDMQPMVDTYAAAVQDDTGWMVGRVIVPVDRLSEFEDAAADHLPRHDDDDPWCISALVRHAHLEADLAAIEAFNGRHATPEEGLAVIDAVEIRASTPDEIEAVAAVLPESLFAFIEIPVGTDPRGLLAQLAGEEMAAKIRTGGIEPHLYPAINDVASFIVHATAAGVPFKATAGLHHPLPNDNPVVGARQLGFLNVFCAAAVAKTHGLDAAAIVDVLQLDDPEAITFDGSTATIGDHTVSAAQIEESRLTCGTTFGSCSIDEPVEDLYALGLLDRPSDAPMEEIDA
ncbi:MAG: hypothetical protein MK074_00100 [Phycisphaerales bacterium]|nr:hypothetical protein [Phycisphaerales bacterium]